MSSARAQHRAITRERVIAILLLLFCGFLFWSTGQIRDPQFGELSPAAWPTGVVYVLTGFCLIYFLQAILAKVSAEAPAATEAAMAPAQPPAPTLADRSTPASAASSTDASAAASTGASAPSQQAEGDDTPQGVVGWLAYFLNPILCFALYFGFLATLPYFGTLIGGTLLVFALLTVLGGISLRAVALHAAIAVLSVGAMWALFTFGLRVLLPRGELIPGI
ncbi:MAG: hypothetical protein AAFR04_12090 [Pseudomonadota bacterium]